MSKQFAIELKDYGMRICDLCRLTNTPRPTVNTWIHGRSPERALKTLDQAVSIKRARGHRNEG